MNNRKQHMLSGYRVLDLTRAVAGPTCTRMFAEMGADVIKVESSPDGERSRAVSRIRNDRSLYTIQQCLNKRSVCVDVRHPDGIALLLELVPHCDIVVESKGQTLQAVGGNVRNSVSKSILTLSPDGYLQPTSGRPWFLIVENRLA